MSTVQRLAVSLVLLTTGLLAGLQMLMLMGLLPAITRMPLATYAGAWQALDHFMAFRMPIFVNATLLLTWSRSSVLRGIGAGGCFGPFWGVSPCW